ncbi:hypothetical protein [Pedobacter nyackensis]|uniref:Uncharacterized protein n=1 Tax=Pedobacter nyackensis TaxID=475255 RepID=A0A1W2DB73_9SPHI|nr:hypothetical protein [Pedobacter nyackensis]SMC94705.1 hypothetical protein SAMN04488101_106122 [Pedobacter nyackensis]
MKNRYLGFCMLLLCLNMNNSFGQRLKEEKISYSYNRLPSATIAGIKNYQVVGEPAYEVKNKQLLEDYKQQKKEAIDKYNREIAVYASLVKSANESYEKAMAEYNKKTIGKKIVEQSLLASGKPQKEFVAKPYLETVELPKLQSSYDYNTILSTYVKLEGYQLDPSNALKIVVLFYGFDHTQPRSIGEEMSNLSSGDGKTSAYKSMVYHTEFSYRHPMAVKVYDPQQKEILSVTPPELNSYKIYKSANSDRQLKSNNELLIKQNEERVLQANLTFINNLLNDKYGYSSVKRDAILNYIKNGDSEYSDLTMAFNEASSGLLMLQQDGPSAVGKLMKANEIWNKALTESDLNNKKARINKEITMGIYFNLLECNFAIGDARGGQSTLEKMNSLSMSNNERRLKLDYDILFAELKKRQTTN